MKNQVAGRLDNEITDEKNRPLFFPSNEHPVFMGEGFIITDAHRSDHGGFYSAATHRVLFLYHGTSGKAYRKVLWFFRRVGMTKIRRIRTEGGRFIVFKNKGLTSFWPSHLKRILDHEGTLHNAPFYKDAPMEFI